MWDSENETWVENGKTIESIPGFAWYSVPSITKPTSSTTQFLDLGFVLHNAKLHEGRALPVWCSRHSIDKQHGKPPSGPENQHAGRRREIEDLMEQVRLRVNPDAPSRLDCFFVSATQVTGQRRHADFRKGRRMLLPCKILLDGPVWFGDIDLFDQVSGTDDQQRAEALAERYWAPSRDVMKIQPENVEVLVGGSLYFPQWETFEPMDMQSLIRLGMVRQMEETLLGMQFKVDRASLDHYLQTGRNLTMQDLAAGLGPNSDLTPAGSGGSKA